MAKQSKFPPLARPAYQRSYMRAGELRAIQGRRDISQMSYRKLHHSYHKIFKPDSLLDENKTNTLNQSRENAEKSQHNLSADFKKRKSLYSAEIIHEDNNNISHIYIACIAGDELQMRQYISRKIGSKLAITAQIKVGFDKSHPIVCELVSDAMAYILSMAERFPHSEIAEGLEYYAEQKFIE